MVSTEGLKVEGYEVHHRGLRPRSGLVTTVMKEGGGAEGGRGRSVRWSQRFGDRWIVDLRMEGGDASKWRCLNGPRESA
ncbi:hypothetical protein V6N12_031540 [Hibiscus sabdariffa]|uniref:Uncharacterized protein n=1 Tax=Hibiscus sabdariffa TaxID=183260 RepID=A0ABR2CPZ1_9ROSI